MKKLSLLLALMLVLTTGVLAACSGDDEDTSKPSLNINTSSTAGGESSTPADDSSAPADDSSAPADDSSAPADDSSAPSDDEPVLPDFTGKTNIAAGMEYVYPTNDAGTHGARTYTGNLTDGTIPATFEFQPEWFGLFNNLMATDGSTNAYLGYGEFVFDLGEAKEIAGVQAYIGWNASYKPIDVTVAVSNDGTTWTEVGALVEVAKSVSNPADGTGVYTYAANVTGSNQFIKIKMGCAPETYWSFISEIEIYA